MATRSKRTHAEAFGEQKTKPVTRSHDDSSDTEDDPSDTEDAKVIESVSFKDAVFQTGVSLQKFTAQDILRIKSVSKNWAAWATECMKYIIKVRRTDESHDWYFPIFGKVEAVLPSQLPQQMLLYGIWHASGEDLNISKLSTLPPLDYLPPPSTLKVCTCNPLRAPGVKFVVRASSAGLLLLEATWGDQPYRIIDHEFGCNMRASDWPSLLVTNPLTRQFQVLPMCNGVLRDAWWKCKADFLMMVDENANSYKVLAYRNGIQSPSKLFVYRSTAMQWEDMSDLHLPIQPSLGRWSDPAPAAYLWFDELSYYGFACRRGRLYLADLRKPSDGESRVEPRQTAVVRLFVADIDMRRWSLHTEVAIRKEYSRQVQMHMQEINGGIEQKRVLRNLELVECRGDLYAVIPARLDEFLYWRSTNRETIREHHDTKGANYMPLQFYIIQLDGNVGVDSHGVLRIDIPPARMNCQQLTRKRSLLKKTSYIDQDQPNERELCLGNWFSCTATGSGIWVSVEDYLLRYDVLSGKCTTEIVPGECTTEIIPRPLRDVQKAGVAYRANFDMKA